MKRIAVVAQLSLVLVLAFAASTHAQATFPDPMKYARHITMKQAVAQVGETVAGTIPGRSGIFVANDLSGKITPIGASKVFYGQRRWKRFRVAGCGYVMLTSRYNEGQVVNQQVSFNYVEYGGIQTGDGYKGSDFPTFGPSYECPE
jgi:hypothetical protein